MLKCRPAVKSMRNVYETREARRYAWTFAIDVPPKVLTWTKARLEQIICSACSRCGTSISAVPVVSSGSTLGYICGSAFTVIRFGTALDAAAAALCGLYLYLSLRPILLVGTVSEFTGSSDLLMSLIDDIAGLALEHRLELTSRPHWGLPHGEGPSPRADTLINRPLTDQCFELHQLQQGFRFICA